MLTKEPALLLERRPEALFQHYQDLRSVLQGDDELARHIVSRLPDILNHRSTAVATRIAEQSAAFQVCVCVWGGCRQGSREVGMCLSVH